MYRQSNVTDHGAITQPEQGAALGWCALGVFGFSVTLPATRLAAQELHPLLLGPGRGAVAGLLALAILWVRRERIPAMPELISLAVVALGVVIGFPLCTTYALGQVPAQHAVVIVGLSPLATSIAAVLRNGERPSPVFWLWALLGASSVVAFGSASHPGRLALAPADGLLLLAVVLAAIGYAEGGRLARTRSGLSVVCWALVIALPLTFAMAAFALQRHPPRAPGPAALAGFAWVAVISALLAFAAWYRGLALGGIARGSQVQLIQPVLSLLWCAILLGETIEAASLLAGGAVLLSAAGSRWARA
jgi:drug/metabolite transporter (DMT)-like permease